MTHEKVLQNFVGYNSWFSTCLLVTQVCVIILTFEYQPIHIYVMRGDIFISYRLRTICGNWDTTMRSTTPPVRLEHNKKGLSRTEDAPHGMQRYLIISIPFNLVFFFFFFLLTWSCKPYQSHSLKGTSIGSAFARQV